GPPNPSGTTTVLLAAPSQRPTLISLVAGSAFTLATPTPVTFSWPAVTGAALYGVEFTGTNRQFANPGGTGPDPVNGLGGAGGGFNVPGTAFATTLPPGFPAGSYQVRVIPRAPTGEALTGFGDALT